MSDIQSVFKPAIYRNQLETAQALTKAQIPFVVLPLKDDGSDFLAMLSIQVNRLEKLANDEVPSSG